MVFIPVPLLYDYVLINDIGDSIDLVHRQQVTLLSAVAYNFIIIMDFQHFIEIGERLKLEGLQLHAFVEKELDKIRIKEEAAAAREDRVAEGVALKEANELLALKEENERVALKEANELLAVNEENERVALKEANEFLALKDKNERVALKEANELLALKEENERVALKESEERRMQHEKDMAAIHIEGDRARADSLNATARA